MHGIRYASYDLFQEYYTNYHLDNRSPLFLFSLVSVLSRESSSWILCKKFSAITDCREWFFYLNTFLESFSCCLEMSGFLIIATRVYLITASPSQSRVSPKSEPIPELLNRLSFLRNENKILFNVIRYQKKVYLIGLLQMGQWDFP